MAGDLDLLGRCGTMLDRAIPRGNVGVVTIIDHGNYGNRLQNYAMQRIIDGFGFTCITILNQPSLLAETRAGRVRSARRSMLRTLLNETRIPSLRRRLLGRPVEDAQRLAAKRLRREKAANGLAFTHSHIRETDFTLYRDTPASHLDALFDYFVAGSDQVWNPNFRKLSEVDFLTFASKPKRIAFSASMGVAEIPDTFREFYRKHLRGFEHISVREEAAAEVVRALTGREVPVTIDPTLMLGPEEWSSLARRHPRQPETEYLLSYFLGPRSAACQALIDRCAARRELGVVHLNDPTVAEFYAADPAQFLALIRDASLLCTDSFHGAIFAVVFGTPFLSFGRTYQSASMDSRLDTLLATLRLEYRKFHDGFGEAEIDRSLEPDFAHVRPIVEKKTAEASAYLVRALGRSNPAAETRALAEAAQA